MVKPESVRASTEATIRRSSCRDEPVPVRGEHRIVQCIEVVDHQRDGSAGRPHRQQVREPVEHRHHARRCDRTPPAGCRPRPDRSMPARPRARRSAIGQPGGDRRERGAASGSGRAGDEHVRPAQIEHCRLARDVDDARSGSRTARARRAAMPARRWRAAAARAAATTRARWCGDRLAVAGQRLDRVDLAAGRRGRSPAIAICTSVTPFTRPRPGPSSSDREIDGPMPCSA